MNISRGIAAALVLFAGGCQLIAGVRTDGELSTGGTGGAGGSGGIQNTGAGGAGGAGGGGGCSAQADCPGGACLAGECVAPACAQVGAPVDLFTSTDLSGHTIDAYKMLLAVDGDRAHLVVSDEDQPRLLARTWTSNVASPTTAVVEVDLSAAGGTELRRARVESEELFLSGRFAEEVGDLVFSVAQSAVQPGPVFMPYPALPAACQQPGFPTTLAFEHLDGSTRYAVTCQGPASRALVIGSDSAPGEVAAEGAADDEAFRVRSYTVRPDGAQLVISGDGDGGGAFYRAGTTLQDLATVNVLRFSDEPNLLTVVAGAGPAAGAGTLLLGATISMLDSTGTLWSGIIDDYSALAETPPSGVLPILSFDMPIFGGFSEVATDASGYYAAGPSLDGKSLNLVWIDPSAKVPLLAGEKILELPAGDTGQIVGAVLRRSPLALLAAWVEVRNGALGIRGARFACSY